MKDKWQAIHEFWSGFGIPAYDESSVPDDAQYPYITYRAEIGIFENVVNLTASVWYRSTSWEDISKKVIEIAESIDQHKLIPYDDGYMYLAKGSPFAQRMADQDDLMRRIYVVTQAEFLSRY